MTCKSTLSTLILFLGISSAIVAQCVRTSELMRTPVYDLQGIATLEQFADGRTEFRLSDDFTTTRGPDVQIFLSNDPREVDNAFVIEDISEIRHFSGAITFELPNGFDIDEFRYVVFRCFAFRVFWGGGSLSMNSCDVDMAENPDNGGEQMEEAVCAETLTATTDWVADITICPNDGIPDVRELRNTQGIPAGDEYAYIITNQNRIIQDVVFEDFYDFEGSPLTTQQVFGVSFMGDLTAQIGQPLSSVTATECATLSGESIFLIVRKVDCAITFECDRVNVSSNGQANVTICPTDGQADIIPFSNNGNLTPGDVFAYLLTDEQDILLEVVSQNSFDFEGFREETTRVYAINYGGNLSLNIGDPISSITASECLEISTGFLTINTGGCAVPFECEMVNVTSNGQTNLTICPTDGQADVIQFSNNGNLTPGENFAYLLTDDQNSVLQIIRNTSFDFEGFGEETTRVFAISYAGDLNLTIGESINSISATECFELSDMTVFLTINKTGCAAATFNVSGQVNSPSGQPIAGVEIMNGNTVLATTNEQGRYTIASVEQGTSYAISPRATTGLTNGVSATDAVRIRGHIIGLEPFTEPYQVIAADINNDNTVSAADIVQIIRAVVGITTEFSNNSPWRFVDAEQSLDANPLAGSITETINITVNSDISNLDFIGVKIGDVNSNADLDLNN